VSAQLPLCSGLLLLAAACGSSPASRASIQPSGTRALVPSTVLARQRAVLHSPPTGPGDTIPPEPVYGARRADASTSRDVAAARSDRHNPALNEFLKGLDLRDVWLTTIPAQPGRTEEVTQVYFDLRKSPYSGALDLFSVRAGGGELKGAVKSLTMPIVDIQRGTVVGLELDAGSDPAAFTPDDPSLVPSSVPSGD
jgi:hypothetical protein